MNGFINRNIKYGDFTVQDKANLVEIFVTHQSTLYSLYQVIFPKSTHVEKMYSNLSTIDQAIGTAASQKVAPEEQPCMDEMASYTDLLNGDLMTSIMSTGKRHSTIEGELERSMMRGGDN